MRQILGDRALAFAARFSSACNATGGTLLERDAVLVQPGYFFDLDMGAALVLSLIVQEQVFADGVARLLARVVARSGLSGCDRVLVPDAHLALTNRPVELACSYEDH